MKARLTKWVMLFLELLFVLLLIGLMTVTPAQAVLI